MDEEATVEADIVVIGGGYYGSVTAIELRTVRPDLKVVIVEQEPRAFGRASSTNQGQLLAGYMYSKFPELAHECANGAKEFAQMYCKAVSQDVLTYYGVHQDSEISAVDYETFCKNEELPLRPIATPARDFFGPSLTRVYETDEKTFDNAKLHKLMAKQLETRGVQLVTSFSVRKIRQTAGGFEIESADGRIIQARTVFNATFADSNKLHERSGIAKLPLDHAVFLHFLIELPKRFSNMGLIVVRGQYAALVPDSSRRASHIFASGQFRVVRTSHIDAPSEEITEREIVERYEQAVAEASSYMPALRPAKLVGHTIGTRTNFIDPATGVAASRAVVLKDYDGMKGYHCVFGGKVACLPEIIEPIRQIAQSIDS